MRKLADRRAPCSPRCAGIVPGRDCWACVTNGFLQSRMIRREWKPGVMHAVIFLGFMALLARKTPADRHRLPRAVCLSRLRRRPVRGGKGRGRTGGAGRGRLCVLAALCAEARAARGESRGAADPVADHRDHGHRSPVRRLPLRAVRGKRRRHCARARLRIRRAPRGRRALGALAGIASGRLCPFLLDAAHRRVRVPGDPAARRAFPYRDRAARRCSFAGAAPPTGCRRSISRRC